MTRINLIDPQELHRKHLVAEYREIVRVFALVRKCNSDLSKKNIPSEYVLGTGHVSYFYPRLGFISKRYDSLCAEMKRRGYTVNRIPRDTLHEGILPSMFGDYIPTTKAIDLNVERIKLRWPKD
jgi:deoxyribonuclease (pyrimidine dimer)